MSSNPKQKHIIQAILTNPKLNEEEKSELVTEFIEEIRNEYPDLKYHATKSDIKELEKEIEQIRLEINYVQKDIEHIRSEAENNKIELTKYIENVRTELKKDIENVRSEAENNKIELTKYIENVRTELKKDMQTMKLELQKEMESNKFILLKWNFIFWITQFIAIITLAYKLIK